MVCSPAGKVTVVKFGMLLKVPWVELVPPGLGQLPVVLLLEAPVTCVFDKSTLSNPLPSNAPRTVLFPALILLTLLGILIDFKAVVPAKLAAAMVCKVLSVGKVTVAKAVAPWNKLF